MDEKSGRVDETGWPPGGWPGVSAGGGGGGGRRRGFLLLPFFPFPLSISGFCSFAFNVTSDPFVLVPRAFHIDLVDSTVHKYGDRNGIWDYGLCGSLDESKGPKLK